MAHGKPAVRVAGRTFGSRQVRIITEIVAAGPDLSRAQLTLQVCRRLSWRRATGAYKLRECRDLLERLERDGFLRLPAKRKGRPLGLRTQVPRTAAGDPGEPLEGTVGELGTVSLELVESRAGRRWWRELVGRYHALGHRVPFGASLRYLAFVSEPSRAVVAAMQISSPAWRLKARDEWIGWDEATREKNLQRVVNHSRFMILPWVRVKNLASRLLALLAGRVAEDWEARYGRRPVLLETMVDRTRYRGTCYRAANWTVLGETTGRGRMDRLHERHGHAPKQILVYPLVRDAPRRLREA